MIIRRSRISVRPNVRPTGRAAPPSQEASQGNDTPAGPSNDAGVEAGAQEVVSETGPTATVPAAETNNNNSAESPSGDVTSQSDPSVTLVDVTGQSAPSSSLSTRRKRFSVLPNLSKPRVTPTSAIASSNPPKSPVRTETPPASTRPFSESPDKHESTQEPAPRPLPVSTKSLRTPAPKLPPPSIRNASRTSRFSTKAVIPTEATTSDAVTTPVTTPELAPELPPAPSDGKSGHRKVKPVTPTQDDTETSSSRSDDAPSLSANQDAAESSCPAEPAPGSQSQNEPVVEEESDPGSPGKSKKLQHQVPLALRTLNDPVDRLRLARARKLRDLLRKEMNKEKQKEKHQRPQIGVTKHKKPKDHTKMTMRELIYYLPSTNPMKSYTDDEQRAETESPSSPKAVPAVQPAPEETAAADEEEEEEEEREGEEEERTLAPRVKVAEDGSLIIDEESLTVQVHRMKGPNLVEERDPIFERGSTTTYSSFRKGTYTKPWSNRETDMFFLAISMVGTDFSMIGQLFPHRGRLEIKNKFKKEERANSWRIDKAFKEKRRLDLDFFKKLLEQILKDEEEKRKKKKQTSQMAKISRQTPRERKRKIYSSESEEEESSSSDTMEGEKENEKVRNDGGSGAAPKRKRAEAVKKGSEHANQSAEQEAEDEAESGAKEDPSPFNELESVEAETETEREAESFGVKPVQRRRNRRPEAEGKTHTSAKDESTKESASNDTESEEEPDLTAIQENILNKPTRSGRIPKLSQHVIRAAADEEDDEEEQQLPPVPRPPDARPRGSQAKRGRWHGPRRGKSRLLTLRAVPAEDEEDEEEECGTNQEEENYSASVEEENQAFVPLGLRTVKAVQAEVEETMEELDISVNVPDVLGISQNAVCPESSCVRALTPMGSVPCEHQLDLLVDVIEFLAPDHMEVSEEAARTLLTIGHSTHVTQTGELSDTGDVIIVEESSGQVHEEVLMETTYQSEIRVETCDAVTSEPSPITSETDRLGTDSTGDKTSPPSPPQDSAPTAEPSVSQESQVPPNENKIQTESANSIVSEPTASKARRNRLPKPKPNLSRVSRTAQRQPAESVNSSTETLSTTGTADTTQESQVLTTEDFVPNTQSQPEPEDQSAEICKEREKDRTEGCSPVLSLEKDTEEGHTGKRTCVADERREEILHTHSESSGSECAVKPSQPVRRCRGPKPKPNLVRSVRTTHPVTHVQQNPVAVPDEKQVVATTLPDIQQPEEGANVPEPERETQCQLLTTTPDVDPDEPPSRPACEFSASDEPVFILSLTEVLPTHTEGAELETDSLTLPAASGSLSEPISAIENAIAVVGNTGPAGDQVFSQVFPDALIPVSEDEETEKRGNETSRRVDEESPSRLPKEKECSPLEQNIIAPVGPDEPPEQLSSSSSGHKTKENVEQAELPAKRRKLPERARRAKLQIKPNPVQRKTCRDLSLDETGSVPASSCEVMSEETVSTSELVPSVVSAEEPSSSLATLDKNSSTPSVATEQSSVTPPPSARTETPPTLVSSSSSSQDSIENIDLPKTEPVDTGASVIGAESQPVHQEVPLTLTETLARPGRRPKGFLSFMSSTSTQRPTESPRSSQKPSVITPRAKRRQAAPSTSATPPPPPPPPPQQEESSHTHAETLTTSSANPSAAEDGEEPTSVSAYFFNDIFTVVDEPEDCQ
ncbi:transcription factor TFIIIB component B'' homolog [Clarias gariepinus]|uniref:transcription factor TFIIIB component B'' homolog n=1 Tax=Clarias gariepinus TaxID=13013 RepID=UPI00234D66C7|nr:transcription factor TFIIIB component B'' homolog [Clarias gariepinus]